MQAVELARSGMQASLLVVHPETKVRALPCHYDHGNMQQMFIVFIFAEIVC